jgi:hypothetical protein
MAEFSDDECIAIATLHGLEVERPKFEGDFWYLMHERDFEVENKNQRANGFFGFDSLADLARAYCEHYNLLR